MDVIGEPNFYIRLRSLQVLASVLECRASQLQECLMNSPTGISTLVGALDDKREQLRNEGLLLLLKLVNGNTELQKRVAFENAYDKVFAIIQEEGGLEGGIVTSDCLTLLYNLLSGNVSNQNWFRETEFFRKITALLSSINKDESIGLLYAKNIKSVLSLTYLFVPRSSKSKVTNQDAFMKSGMTTQVVGLAFASQLGQDIRAAALMTLADLIYNNKTSQDYSLRAIAIATDPLRSATPETDHYSILWKILLESGEDAFAMRDAASHCLEAFISGNEDRKLSAIQHMIQGFFESHEANLLSALINISAEPDQYKIWFASCTLLHLTHEDEITRDKLTELTIGDAEAGEEEVSIIQTLSANLISALQNKHMRSAVAYLMLLTSWMFDSPENVADFLEEGSTLQVLIGHLQAEDSTPVLRGLCAILLSIVYAFNFSETTTISRGELQAIILRLGREIIIDSIHYFSRLGEVSLASGQLSSDFEDPLLDTVFIDFFRDHFGLIRKAIDQPPVLPRTRRQEQELELQERTEDMLADLESELERKSSGLEEAVNIIRTRQEELQRLRDEIKYMSRKYEVEKSQLQTDLEKAQLENIRLKEEAVASSNEIDKALRDNAVIRAELESAYTDLRKAQANYDLALSQAKTLEGELSSESSKRSFLETEVSKLRETSSLASEQLDSSQAQILVLQQELESSNSNVANMTAEFKVLKEDLNSTHALARKLEAEVTSYQTKTRDLGSDLEGAKQQIESDQSAHDRELKRLNDALNTTQESHAKLLNTKDSEAALLSQSLSENALLRERLKKSVEEVQELLDNGTRAAEDNHKEDRSQIAMLKVRLEQVEREKADLQGQLEQAQEDLMLLMDDSPEADEIKDN